MKNYRFYQTLTFIPLIMVVFLSGCKYSSKDANGGIVIPIQIENQTPLNLRTAGNYVILAGSEITNNPTSSIIGNVGISPAASSSITGFSLTYTSGGLQSSSVQITGIVHAVDYASPTPINLTSAKLDLSTVYTDAAGRASAKMVVLSGNIGGLTLTPGLYKSSGSLEISKGDLTFDAKGNSSAVFIIQIATTLSASSGRKVILAGGAMAKNIFWQVGTSATFGTTSEMKGIVMADQSITMENGATIDGRLLARNAAVSLDNNKVVAPSN